MALSEAGEYVGTVVSETGKRLFGSLLEDGRFVFGVSSGAVLNTITPTERQDASDALRFQHFRVFPDNFQQADAPRFTHIRLVTDQFGVVDLATATRLAGPTTVVGSDQVAIHDGFISKLLKNIRETSAIEFAEQVAIQLITRDLRFTDNVHLSDAALLTEFSGEIEALVAGIRTFTCTPGYDIQREAITKTAVADFDQPGLFSATNGAQRPAYRFVVNIPALTRIQVQSLQAFHFFHQGAKAFYINGFEAWSYVSTLNLIGEGNGSKKDFFLPNRNIDANSITVAVFDGVTHSITSAYSLNPVPGIISFTTAPTSGHDIEASHAHKYKVVFEPDGLKTDEFASGVWKAQLKLRELAV